MSLNVIPHRAVIRFAIYPMKIEDKWVWLRTYTAYQVAGWVERRGYYYILQWRTFDRKLMKRKDWEVAQQKVPTS